MKGVWVEKVLPALIFLALWADGWFYPLLLLPVLYVLLVEKKTLGWLGFMRERLLASASLGAFVFLLLVAIYIPVRFHYARDVEWQIFPLSVFLVDILWYPLYEEVAYRSFFLAHFARPEGPLLSRGNLVANLSQSLFFLSIHGHHVAAGVPLILIPVFLLGLLNGFLFLRTRNVAGCILSHSATNAFALLLPLAMA